eukprot:COSAG01_NODE_155_length_23814_cov_12.061343_23_plen_52_part_00
MALQVNRQQLQMSSRAGKMLKDKFAAEKKLAQVRGTGPIVVEYATQPGTCA